MEKIISETKRKRIERDSALLSEYKQLMRKGSDKTAVYQYLADKYRLQRASSVYLIIKKHTEREKPNVKQ